MEVSSLIVFLLLSFAVAEQEERLPNKCEGTKHRRVIVLKDTEIQQSCSIFPRETDRDLKKCVATET